MNQTHDSTNFRLGHLIVGRYINSSFHGLVLKNGRRGGIRISYSNNVRIFDNNFSENGRFNVVGGVASGNSMVDVALGVDCENIAITKNKFDGQGELIYSLFAEPTQTVNLAILAENAARRIRIVNNEFGSYGDEAIQFLRWDAENPNVQDDTNRPRQNVVAGNVFNCSGYTLYAVNCGENADNISVHDNVVIQPRYHGFRVSPWSKNIFIEQNEVISPARTGVSIAAGVALSGDDRFGNIVVRGNKITGAGEQGIVVLGNAGAVLYGLFIDDNIVKNCGQSAAGFAGIRVAADIIGGSICRNTSTDDQPTKTQSYGLVLANPSGGGSSSSGVKVFGNDLRGNLTDSALVSWGAARFFCGGNLEGDVPRVVSAVMSYTALAAGGGITGGALPANDGKYEFRLRPDLAGGSGVPVASLIVSGGNLFPRVNNISSGSPCSGNLYVFRVS